VSLQAALPADTLTAAGSLIKRRKPDHLCAAILSVAVALLTLAAFASSPAWAVKTKRVSVKSNGNEVNVDNDFPAISANGRFVAFESPGKFTKGDDDSDSDVFVHDRKTGKTRRVSVKSNGHEAPDASSADAQISANGRFVAFTSDGNLGGGDHNNMLDVYLRDRQTGKTKRMSIKSSGGGVPYDSYNPAISANGRYVAFQTIGALVNSDTNNVVDVYIHDRKTGNTKRVSIRSNGTEPTQNSTNPTVSGDGRFVGFQSWDGQMTADSDYQFMVDFDVFVRDMKNHTTTRMSLKSNGDEADPTGNQSNFDPTISTNGRFITFSADQFGAFVPSDNNNVTDVYIHDRTTGKTQIVSVTSNEQPGNNSSGADAPAGISADGRFVAFEAYAQLVGNDNNDPFRDIYVRDRKMGKTRLVSVNSKGDQVLGYNHQLPALSEDGRWVAWSSMGKFTGGDAGSDFDAFERGPLR
jgi:hypothetical protein